MRKQFYYLEDGKNTVDLMDLGVISSLAVALKPIESSEHIEDLLKILKFYLQVDNAQALKHIAALHEYMINNRDNILFNSYNLLISDSNGKKILCTNIELCLLEKSFREEGATEETIKKYAEVVNKYHNYLEENKKLEPTTKKHMN